MTPNTRTPIPWTRYWVRGDRLGAVQLDGPFLRPPGELQRRYDATAFESCKTIPDLAGVSCLVLLGSSGLGKSHELRRLVAEHPTTPGHQAAYINLRGRSAPTSILSAFQSDPAYQGWIEGRHALTLAIDSLDECQRRVCEVGEFLCEEFRRQLVPSRPALWLRLGCRAPEWNAELNSALEKLFPSRSTAGAPSVQTWHLERLTRAQVAFGARHRGGDADAFLAEVDHLQLGALAAHPITLELLLNEHAAGRPLGTTRIQVYEQGLASLCRDLHQIGTAQPRNVTTPGQRLEIAARLAAIGVLSDRYSFSLDPEQPPPPASSLVPAEDLLGAAILDGIPPVTAPVLKETLWCGLFDSAPEGGVTWRHRSFAEFLAARYLSAHVAPGDLPGLFCDITTSTARLHPPLEEVAAWLAEFSPEFFDLVADANAEVFFRCDPHLLQNRVRERLTAAYLRRIEEDDAEAPGWMNELPVDRLNHPGLADQLRPIILDLSRSEMLRRAALVIADACRCRELARSCASLLYAVDTPSALVAPLGHLLRETIDDDLRSTLRPLFLAAPSPSEDVVAWSIQLLWPRHLNAEELVGCLPPPPQWERNGSLRFVCSGDIPNRAPVEHLPTLLRWLRANLAGFRDRDFFGAHTKERLALAAFRHLHDPAVRSEFIALLAAQTHDCGRFLPAEKRDLASEAFQRRLLVSSLIEEHPNIFADNFGWLAWSNGLRDPSDLAWAVEQLRAAATTGLRQRWMTYAFMVFDGTQAAVDMIAPILDLVPSAAEILARRTSCQLEEAGYPNWEKGNFYRRLEEEQKKARKPAFASIIAQALGAYQTGNIDAMPWLWRHLTHYREEPPPGQAQPRKSARNGWALIDAELTRRIHAAMPAYLDQIAARADLLAPEGQGNNHSNHALPMLLEQAARDSEWFARCPPEFWRAWQRPILLSGHMGLPKPEHLHRPLVERLYRAGADTFVSALDEALLRHRKQFFDTRLIQAPCVLADTVIRQLLLRHVRDGETNASLRHGLWDLLLRDPMPEAEAELARSAAATPPDPFAAATLLVHRTATHGPTLSDRMIADAAWLRSVCLALPGNGFDVRSDWALLLPPAKVLRLWESLGSIAPDDPYADGGGEVTPEKTLYHLRNNLLNLLAAKPTPEGCEAVRDFQARRPELKWLGQMRVRMRKALRRADWVPLRPCQARDYLDDKGASSPVTDEGVLCQRVLDALADFQGLIRDVPNPSNELWNTPAAGSNHWHPKDENEVSNRLLIHLNNAFRSVGGHAVRESESRRGHAPAGDPTDLPDLVVAAPSATHPGTILRVVIEVKCAWHDEAITALRTQLAERYLRTFRCGVYCLVHFTCPTWDLPGDPRRERGKARLELAMLAAELDPLRDTLRLEYPEKRIETVLLDARR